ncbi:MAG: ABC transporter permease [Pseudomonadota bacterium]
MIFATPVSMLHFIGVWLSHLGGMTKMALGAFTRIITGRIEVRETLYQVDALGVKSLSIALLTAMFTGMVLALQFGHTMARFGAKDYVGNAVSVAILRELGPVLTTLLVGGRIGSGMTAELGSMAVTEQIDAIKALGADPVTKLVVPRVLAVCVIMPLLAVFADLVGLVGGMLLAKVEFGISFHFFVGSIFESCTLGDFFSGVGKTLFFGFFIAIIACYMGFTTRGGTEGVGNATTATVVLASVNTLVADFFLTKILFIIGV